jgi:hypothetical protein
MISCIAETQFYTQAIHTQIYYLRNEIHTDTHLPRLSVFSCTCTSHPIGVIMASCYNRMDHINVHTLKLLALHLIAVKDLELFPSEAAIDPIRRECAVSYFLTSHCPAHASSVVHLRF